MRVNLEAAGLWHAVEPEKDNDIEYREDRLALAVILRLNAVKTVHVGVQRVREANAQQLLKDIGDITFKDGESVDDFSVRIVGLANQIRTLGATVPDAEVVKKMLQSVPEHLEQIACSIETLLDVDNLSIEEVTGRLRAIEQRKHKKKATASRSSQAPIYDSQGCLLMAAEDWLAKLKLRTGDDDAVSGSGSGGSKKRGKPRPATKRTTRAAALALAGRNRPMPALNCGKRGHWAKDCRSKPKKQSQAHHVEGEEEDSILMVALGTVSSQPLSSPCTHSISSSPSAPAHRVDLIEAKVFAQLGPQGEREPHHWLLDTGATNHMTGAWTAFSESDTGVRGSVKFGDGSLIAIEGRGLAVLECKDGGHRALTRFIPRLTTNIISLGQLDKGGHRIDIGHGVLRVYDTTNKLLVKVQAPAPASTSWRPVCQAARSTEATWLWHGRYGHLGFANLRKLARKWLVRGLPSLEDVNQVCDGCLLGKQRHASFPAQARWRTNNALELVHGDLCGPITPTTPSGNRYFLLLVDDMSQFMWIHLLASKDQAALEIKNFQATAEVESSRKLKVLRTDRGEEFTSAEFGEYCTARGVQRPLTAPYSPQQNGVVEWRNQSIVSMARCMLKSKLLPSYFWGEAVCTAVFILNRAPTRALEGKTLYEAWHVSRDVVFDEGAHWKWESAAAPDDLSMLPFTVEHDVDATHTWAPHSSSPEPYLPAPTASPSPAPTTPAATPSLGTRAAPATPPDPVQFMSPPDDGEPDLDADHDDAPLRFHTIDSVLGPASPLGLVPRVLDEELYFSTTAEEPASFAEAEREELAALPNGHRAIRLKWVFKVKRDEAGKIVRHKARLVAKGYVQRTGIDFDEVFALVARMESVRALLALAVHQGHEVHHMDVKSVFLNGDLKEEVFVSQPPGFIIKGSEHKVLHLHKALYGLRQAPRAWNAKLDASLGSLGFQRSSSEHGIYIKDQGPLRLVVGVYIDDLIITGARSCEILAFKMEMKRLFSMSDLGLLSYYLGIEVRQSQAGITLCQTSYARKLLECGGMESCNPRATPMDVQPKLSKFSETPSVNATEYRQIIGGLRYLVHTWPDLAYAVGYLSRFMEAPHQEHQDAVKQVLRYVAGTCSHSLFYAKRQEGHAQLIGYSDADMAGDVDGRKSTSGIIFFLGGNAITWQSSKQKVVALSSCEAEYIAMATAACQAVWLAWLVTELGVDNQSAIALAKNPVHHDRSKHIDTKFHYIRECSDRGRITLRQTPTEEQLADLLTKSLGRDRFQELALRLESRKSVSTRLRGRNVEDHNPALTASASFS
ncbi:LOW QUALITY PROTEIN: hypothetical protein U9M48_027558 [Paspalum notatum var. saurae]|uniref:Integrase catalytic domain-containing protein n=1 Tax=Paspalum notatum var. saurae TaxID=547442 RepID=A0AAQ3TV30_PASNO